MNREHDAPETAARWRLLTRIAFRFWFLYFGLYACLTQILTTLILLPGIEPPDVGTLPPLRAPVVWVARHVFGVASALVVTDSGSGDKIFDWVQVFCLLALAAAGTLVWSVRDRRGEGYVRLYAWFRVFVRFALGSTLLVYGIVKIVPLQMPYPSLARLVEPFGDLSPMGVLWASIGASPGYETFSGCAETLGGILLLLPRTALLGALIGLADAIQVFTLNMTYDVPVKLLSFHMILMAAFLIAPELPRLLSFFLLDRGAGPSRQPQLFRTPRANRNARIVQGSFALYLIGANLYGARKEWIQDGGGAPLSPLYGIWNVEQMASDGEPRPPLVTDSQRWRRVLFQSPKSATFQRMDNSFARFGTSIDAAARKIELSKNDDEKWRARFTFERPNPGELTLDGSMDGHRLQLRLKLVDHTKWLLLSRGFHWVQEYPFNR